MPLSDDLLMAGLMDALDPGDSMALDDLTSQDIEAGLRRAGLGFLAEVGGALAPPLNLGAEAPVLGAEEGYRVGERIAIPLPSELPPASMKVAVFHSCGDEVQLIFPTPGEPWPTLEAFRVADGAPVLDLVALGPPGLHTYTIALVPALHFEEPWPLGDRAWDQLRRSVESGALGGDILTLEIGA